MKRRKNTAKAVKSAPVGHKRHPKHNKTKKITAKAVEKPYEWDYAMFEAIAEGYNL